MLIDKTKLNSMLQDFYVIAGVRIAIFDRWQREIAAYPATICEYCKMRRKAPDFDKLCRDSDAKAFEIANNTRSQYTYQCHAGLYERVSPIVSDNVVIGFLMIGQFLDSASPDKDPMGVEYGDGIPKLPMDKINAIASITSICSEYLCFSKTVSIRRTNDVERAKQYVRDNLNGELTVQNIADALGISRTSTHNLFRRNFGKSVTEYVNSQKIEVAKKMISEGRSTAEIIEAINIADANYFYRTFKKCAGQSLSEYKSSERARNSVSD